MKIEFPYAAEIVPSRKFPSSGLREIRPARALIELSELITKMPGPEAPCGVVYSDESQLFALVETNWDLSWPGALTEQALNALGYEVCDLAFFDPDERMKVLAELRQAHPDLLVDVKRLKSRLKGKKLIQETGLLKEIVQLDTDPGKYAAITKKEPAIYGFHFKKDGEEEYEIGENVWERHGEDGPSAAALLCEGVAYIVRLFPADFPKAILLRLGSPREAQEAIENCLSQSLDKRPVEVRQGAHLEVRFPRLAPLKPKLAVPPVSLFDPGRPLTKETFRRVRQEPPPWDQSLIAARLKLNGALPPPQKALDEWQAVAAWQRTKGPIYDPSIEPSAGRILLSEEEFSLAGSAKIEVDDGEMSNVIETYRALCVYPNIYKD